MTLSKLLLAASLCLFGSNIATAALSAVTVNTIQGTKPKLSTALEAGITGGSDFGLFGINDGTNNYFTDAGIKGAFRGLNLSSAIDTPTTFMAAFNASNTLAFGVPSTLDAEDSDGDIFDAIEEKTAGSVVLKWYKAGSNTPLTAVQLSQSFCKLGASGITPELRAEGAITLKTKYGDPREQDYPDASIGVTKTPKRVFNYADAFVGGAVCYARPELREGTGVVAGPVSMWDPANGFIPQSETIYSQNFPTTGADGLEFDLVLTGVDATTLTWPVVMVNGITATASVINATTVKITLTGPKGTPAQHAAINPGAITKPGVSQFVIEGKSGATVKVKYGFELKKWYINRGNITANASAMGFWCRGAGYRLPTVGELTSARGSAAGLGGVIPTVPFPNYQGYNVYWRRIGGGLFSEWGEVQYYTSAGFLSTYYCTSDTTTNGQFLVYLRAGTVDVLPSVNPYNGVCIF